MKGILIRQALGVLAIAGLVAGVAHGQTYVNSAVAASGSGNSPANAYKTITEAVEGEGAGETFLIAGGTYNEEPDQIVALEGMSFIGSWDPTFTTIDFDAHPTIIDCADREGTGLVGLDQEVEQRAFYILNQIGAGVVFENLIIQNASGGKHTDTDGGGAVFIRASEGPHIFRNVHFMNCTAPQEYSNPLTPEVLREGGAIVLRNGSNMIIEDCVFSGCFTDGTGGGAISLRDTDPDFGSSNLPNNLTVRRSLFIGNGAQYDPGSNMTGGSAINSLGNSSGGPTDVILIENCVFVNNGATDGDLVDSPGPVIRINSAELTMVNNTFVNNQAPGTNAPLIAFTADDSDYTFINNLVQDNTFSGPLLAYGSNVNATLTFNLFDSNSSAPLGPTGGALVGERRQHLGPPGLRERGQQRLYAGGGGARGGCRHHAGRGCR